MPALLSEGARQYNKSRRIHPRDTLAQLGYYQDATSGSSGRDSNRSLPVRAAEAPASNASRASLTSNCRPSLFNFGKKNSESSTEAKMSTTSCSGTLSSASSMAYSQRIEAMLSCAQNRRRKSRIHSSGAKGRSEVPGESSHRIGLQADTPTMDGSQATMVERSYRHDFDSYQVGLREANSRPYELAEPDTPTGVATKLVASYDRDRKFADKQGGQLRKRAEVSFSGRSSRSLSRAPSSLHRWFLPNITAAPASSSGAGGNLSRLKRRNAGRTNRRMVGDSHLGNPYALSELFSQSEIPGFREIFASDSYLRKFCWIVAFVLMTLWSLNDMSALVSEYNEHPITVNVLLRDSARLTFPAVTVCNLNVVRFSALCSPNSKFDIANKIPAELRDKLCGIQVDKKTGNGNRTDISDINQVGAVASTTTAAPATSSTTSTTTTTTATPNELASTSGTPKLSDHGDHPGPPAMVHVIHINNNNNNNNNNNKHPAPEHKLDRPPAKRGPHTTSRPSQLSVDMRKPNRPTRSIDLDGADGPFGSPPVRLTTTRSQPIPFLQLERASQFNKQSVNLQTSGRPGGGRLNAGAGQAPNGLVNTLGPSSGSQIPLGDLSPALGPTGWQPLGSSSGPGSLGASINGLGGPSSGGSPGSDDFELTERQERELQETLSNWLAVMHQRDPELTLSLGHQFDDMIMRCTMKSINCTHQRSFESQFSPTEGNCFTYRSRVKRRSRQDQAGAGSTISSGAPLGSNGATTGTKSGTTGGASGGGIPLRPVSVFEEANLAGTSHGLELVLNLEKHEYISGSSQVGALVMIHHPGDLGYAASEAIFVAPEFTTYIGLKMVNIKRLPAPYLERCVDAWPTKFAESLIRNSTYSQQDCIRICLQQTIQQHCACQYAFLPTVELDSSSKQQVDSTASQSTVTTNYSASSASGSSHNPQQQRIIICDTRRPATRQCVKEVMSRAADRVNNCECPAKCAVVRYDKTVSMARWPTREDKVTFDRGKSDVNFQNLAKVIVYFQTMTCEEVSQEAVYSMTKILSALGGIMGMYVGFSFLSVFEIFEVMSRKIWHHFIGKISTSSRLNMMRNFQSQPQAPH